MATMVRTPAGRGRMLMFLRAGAAATLLLGGFVLALAEADVVSAKEKGKIKAKVQGTTLVVTGSAHDDDITFRLSANDPDTLEIDVDDKKGDKARYRFKRDAFDAIVVDAGRGNDAVTIDESHGVFTNTEITTINGEEDDDTIVGGSGAETLDGGSGNDSLAAKGGTDLLRGGDGDDVLTAGDGNDDVLGEAGNDRMVWNPGDDTDLNVGGDGTDTVEVNGGNGAELFTATANGSQVRLDRINPAPFSIDIATSESLVLKANGGDDQFSATGDLAVLIAITVDGGTGDDTIHGGNGRDVLLGGDGGDVVDGQQGNDTALLGAGDDVFVWDPGDGSDAVDGGADADTLRFNGSGIAETFEASAVADHVRFTRNIGTIAMDLDGIETLDLSTLGGADTAVVNDVTGTDLARVDIDLAGTIGGLAGDGQADTVIVNGTGAADVVDVLGSGTSVAMVGLPALLSATNVEAANDTLVVNTLGGDDQVSAVTLVDGIVKLTVDGGAEGDTIGGSRGRDILIGGDGHDNVDGQQGDDTAFLGAGDDVFTWDPGDGSDTVEGQADFDTLRFAGSNAGEHIDIVPNGGRVLFVRDVASITMDLDDTERIELRALGGADTIVIGDLSGTDATQVALDLAGAGGIGDAAADAIIVNGTNGDDVFSAAGNAAGVNVSRLTVAVAIVAQESANDRLTLNALAGEDVVDATSLEADGIALTVNGGLGEDTFFGSEGDERFLGGDGDDTALMGAGDDTFTWNPGDDNDTIEGQAGFDTLVFNGANIAEDIEIAANGGRVLFTRNVASVTMDLDDTERITFNAVGGADTVLVGDLSGTDAVEVNLDLAMAGGGDGQPDAVIVNGTNGDDTILVVGDASGTGVIGLAAQVNITGAESANDRLAINALAGDDVVDATALGSAAIQLTADGGGDDDILTGGDGNDTLSGGNGDDVLVGGPGIDILDGGPGDNVLIQD